MRRPGRVPQNSALVAVASAATRARHCVTALGAAVLAVGCSSTQAHKAATVTKGAAREAWTATRGATAKFSDYVRNADFWKKNHDSSNFGDLGVLHLLRKAGVLKGKQPGVGPAPGVHPFPVGHYKGDYGWPLEAGVVSSEFGARWGRPHKGIDVAAAKGEPVYASADGEVIYAGNGLTGYGNVVIVRHDEVTTTLYAHNSSLKVKAGVEVKAGTVIARVGSTGHSTGPHCHFEYRDQDVAINPREKLIKSPF